MFNAATFNSIVFNSASAKVQKSAGDTGSASESIDKPFFDIFELGTALDLAAQNQGSVVTAATSTNDGSTRTPAGRGVLLALTHGDMVLLYQAGTEGDNGILMRLSADRGVTWGSATQITSKEDVYPSAVVQRDTNDIHLVYSRDESTPTLEAASSVFYRRLRYVGTPASPSFLIGDELSIMLGSTDAAYERASIDIDSNNVPFCAALRNTASGNTVAVAIGAVAGNLAGAKIDTSVVGINLASADVSIATASIGTDWFVGLQSGGTFWLTRATGPNVGLQTIEFTSISSWSTDAVHTIAVAGHASGRYVYVAYIQNTNVFVRKWDNTLGQIISTTNIGSGYRASLAVDESYAWVFYIQHVGTRTLVNFATEGESWASAVITTSTTASEDWDWPNSVKRIDDAQAAVVAWSSNSETTENIYVSSQNIEIPKAATESPVGTETINNKRGLDELSTVQDVAGIGEIVGDVVIHLDSATAQGTPKVIEAVTATEDLTKVSESIDSSIGTDTFYIIPLLDGETATATDDAEQKNQVAVTETRTGTDSVRPTIQAAELATLTDVVSQLIRVVAETSTGTETLVNDRRASETGHGADATSFYINASEISVATFLISRALELLENPAGADTISGFNRPVSDSGHATDVAKWEYVIYEVAAANDISVQEARAVATTMRLLIQKSEIKLRTEGY